MGRAEAHTTTFACRLIASVRARLNDRSRSFEAELKRLFWMKERRFGTATPANTPATASVTMSSVSVKPRCGFMFVPSSAIRECLSQLSAVTKPNRAA